MNRLPALALGLALIAPVAFAECARESAPTVPDGSAASLEEMTAAQQAVKAFVASGNAYLECLAAEGTAAPADEAPELKNARIEKHNAAVDEMSDVANRFNGAIQAFKAKN
jgi:hypothetical protein